MSDWVTPASSLATAAGTLVLAVATFSSVRSANRAARVAEQSLLVGMRPQLIPSRDQDPAEHVMFGDDRRFDLPGHGALVKLIDGNVYMAIGVRNAGAGTAVLHAWRAARLQTGPRELPDLEEFTRQARDIYIPAGEQGFWQGAMRDPSARFYDEVAEAARERLPISVDLLYGDQVGGQRTVARFGVTMDDRRDGRWANVVRYWNVDGDDPR